MEFEGDSPAPRPPEVALGPVAVTTQNLQVTPENIVALAKMFSDCADILEPEVANIDRDLRLPKPWMGDPVSQWARERFNDYFVDGEHAFATVLKGQYAQHLAMVQALTAAAERYGMTEELHIALMNRQGRAQ